MDDHTTDSDKSPESSTKRTESLPSQKKQQSVESSPSSSKDSDVSHGRDLRKTQDSSKKASEKGILKSTSRERNAESDTFESKTDSSSVKSATAKTKMSDDASEVSRAKKHKTIHSASDRDVEQPVDHDCSGNLRPDDSISHGPERNASASASIAAALLLCHQSVIKHSSSYEIKTQSPLPLPDSSKISESDPKLASHSPCGENDRVQSVSSSTDKNSAKDTTSERMDVDVKETGSDFENEEIIIEHPPFTASNLYPDEEDTAYSPSSYLNEKVDEPSVSPSVPGTTTGGEVEIITLSSDESTGKDEVNTDPIHSRTDENSTKDSTSKKTEGEENKVCPHSKIEEIAAPISFSFSPSMYPDSDAGYSPSAYEYINTTQNESSGSDSPSVGMSENNREAAPHSSCDKNADLSPTKADVKRKHSTSSEE